MSKPDDDFLKRLLATFRLEAEEHLLAMSSGLLELEAVQPDQQAALVETLFREAHSLKGAARSVNLQDIEQVCQALERVLSALKRQQVALSPRLVDVLHRSVDGLGSLLARSGEGKAASTAKDAAALIQGLEALVVAPATAAPPARSAQQVQREAALPAALASAEAAPTALSSTTVRISTAKLEDLQIQVEELLAFKFGADHLADELRALSATLAAWMKRSDKRARQVRMLRRAAARPGLAVDPAAARARSERMLVQLLDAAENDELVVRSLVERCAQLERTAMRERRALGSMVDHLQGDMKQVLMLPFASLLELVPKLVRDLARDQGKEVELHMQGAALEIDRRVLEQMKTPLIHLIRNAVDHGIETPAERQRANKPSRGRITVEVAPREGNKVELLVVDDGGGIDLAKVKAKAQKMGLLSSTTLSSLDEPQAMALVFESGLSTSPILTELSGHGLGLAIVREKIERLGGSIALESQPGAGTRFRITLPAALATFQGLLVTVGEQQFVLPSRNVERVTRVKASAVGTVENREAVELDRQVLSLVRLREVLELPQPAVAAPRDSDYLPLAIVANGGKRVAFAVDEIVGDQEVLVKPLSAPLKRVRNVAGVTVLGAGRVVPLLDAADLLKSAQRAGAPRVEAARPRETEEPQASLLVVEDSITSRVLLKGILELAGYQVTTAVDGIDALTTLRSGHFDLVVSDVEMPRLDGFDLTTRIRADKQLADLPVVLVTALDTREDKERGIDVGANAYIVKSSFDQSDLLTAIRGLI